MARFFPAELHDIHWPQSSWLWLGDVALNDAGLRQVLRPWIGVPVLESQIREVVYLNWMLPRARVAELLPPGLEAIDLDGFTPLSILTYQHGYFGPKAWGKLRKKFCFSPYQSNWRLYLQTSPPGQIYFLKSVLSSPLYTWGARLLSDGLPVHYAPLFMHRRQGENVYTRIEPLEGSAPDLRVLTGPGEKSLPPAFVHYFENWEKAVSYLMTQTGALAMLGDGQIWQARIDLPMTVADALPLKMLYYSSQWLKDLVQDQTPLVFGLNALDFQSLGEGPFPRAKP